MVDPMPRVAITLKPDCSEAISGRAERELREMQKELRDVQLLKQELQKNVTAWVTVV